MRGNSFQPYGSAPIGIQLRHLRYFLAVLEELHFGRAAERLNMSQPPLSQAIRRLEEELGVQLLERSSHGVAPTEAGLVFGEETRKVLASVDLVVAKTRRAAGVAAALRVGCTPHFPIGRVQLFLAALHKRLRPAHAEVAQLLSAEQLRRLRVGELDLGIVQATPDEPDVEMEPVFPGDRLEVFFSANHDLAEEEVVGPEDLRDQVLCLLPRAAQPRLNDLILALIGHAGYEFRDVREVGGTDPRDLLFTIATEGGVTVAPQWFRAEGAGLAVVVSRLLDPPVRGPDVAVAWRADPPAHLRSAVAAARDVARELHRTWLPPLAEPKPR